VLYVPLLLALGLGFGDAASTSLAVIMATSASASVSYFRSKRIDWRLLLMLEPLSTAGAFAGGFFSGHISDFILKIIFAGVLMVTGYLMLRSPLAGADVPDFSEQDVLVHSQIRKSYRAKWPQLMSVSALAGAVSGMVGIAGGTMKIPVMVMVGGVPISIAVGTSAAMIGMTAAAGFAGHFALGHFNWLLLLPVLVAAILGGQIGPRISRQLKSTQLRKLFAFVLLFISLAMVVEALW